MFLLILIDTSFSPSIIFFIFQKKIKKKNIAMNECFVYSNVRNFCLNVKNTY